MNMNFFDMNNTDSKPLADRMRPRTLQEFIGQEHLVGKGCLLRRAIEANRLTSCIFYGPPGTGKTSLARVISNVSNSAFEQLNAVMAGVSEVRDIIKAAAERKRLYGKETYLLLDECHRWSKAQSDSVLPALEDGTIRLIGSTTENPNISMTPAILSRCMVFEFKRLNNDDIIGALRRALSDPRGFGNTPSDVCDQALKHFAAMSGGDLRSAYNALELAMLSEKPDSEGKITVTLETAEQSVQKRVIACDETTYFDMLSAFCKSLRGSDIDGALFWACRMLRAGVDPRIIARRLTAHASEDVGLADPMALLQAQAALTSAEKIGMPECLLNLAQAIAYVCAAPKSNSVLAVHAIWEAAEQPVAVPPHLCNDPYRGRHGVEGHSDEYKYPHNYPGHYTEQQYLPDSLQGRRFFTFSQQGYEKELALREFYKKQHENDNKD